MNQLTTFRWSFDEDLFAYRDAGYDGVALWLRKVLDYGEDRAVELLDETGLGVTCLSWVGGFTGADVATAQENLTAACRGIDLAAELRAGCLKVYPGGRNLHTHRHAERLLRGSLDYLLPHAERMGVVLALEPMHPACAGEWTPLTDLRRTLDLVRDYDSSALRLAVDSYHFPLADADPAFVAELAGRLALVHVGDYVEPHGVDHARVPLGEGDAPLGRFVGSLLEAGYSGPLDVKLMGPDIEPAGYDGLLRRSRDVLAELASLAPAGPEPHDACNATW